MDRYPNPTADLDFPHSSYSQSYSRLSYRSLTFILPCHINLAGFLSILDFSAFFMVSSLEEFAENVLEPNRKQEVEVGIGQLKWMASECTASLVEEHDKVAALEVIYHSGVLIKAMWVQTACRYPLLTKGFPAYNESYSLLQHLLSCVSYLQEEQD